MSGLSFSTLFIFSCLVLRVGVLGESAAMADMSSPSWIVPSGKAHHSPIISISTNQDKRFCLTLSSAEGGARLWDLNTSPPKLLKVFRPWEALTHNVRLTAASLNHDGTLAALAGTSRDGVHLYFFDTESGAMRLEQLRDDSIPGSKLAASQIDFCRRAEADLLAVCLRNQNGSALAPIVFSISRDPEGDKPCEIRKIQLKLPSDCTVPITALKWADESDFYLIGASKSHLHVWKHLNQSADFTSRIISLQTDLPAEPRSILSVGGDSQMCLCWQTTANEKCYAILFDKASLTASSTLHDTEIKRMIKPVGVEKTLGRPCVVNGEIVVPGMKDGESIFCTNNNVTQDALPGLLAICETTDSRGNILFATDEPALRGARLGKDGSLQPHFVIQSHAANYSEGLSMKSKIYVDEKTNVLYAASPTLGEASVFGFSIPQLSMTLHADNPSKIGQRSVTRAQTRELEITPRGISCTASKNPWEWRYAGRVHQLALSAQGEWLFAACDDGLIYVFDAKNGKKKLTLLVQADGARCRWAAWMPDGTYAHSESDEDLLSYCIPAGDGSAWELPAQKIASARHRPELVKLALDPAPKSLAAFDAKLLPPHLRLHTGGPSGELLMTESQSSVQVRFTLDHPYTGHQFTIHTRLNGRMTESSTKSQPNQVYSVEVNIPANLQQGTVSVLTETKLPDRTVTSLPQVITFQKQSFKGGAIQSAKRLHLVAAGASAYKNCTEDQTIPSADLEAVSWKRLFETQIKSGTFAEMKSWVMQSRPSAEQTAESIKESSVSNIRHTLQTVASEAAPEDLVVFCFSGHGVLQPQSTNEKKVTLYLATADYDGSAENSGLSSAELFQLLSKIKAPVVVFLDTCHAAAALTLDDCRSWDELGMAIFAASRSTESALSNEELHSGDPFSVDHGGLFTSLIRKCLRLESDTKKITLSGLSLFIRNHFPKTKKKEINELTNKLRNIEKEKLHASSEQLPNLIQEADEYAQTIVFLERMTQSPVIILPNDVPNLTLASPANE